jgi:hypothetical protein
MGLLRIGPWTDRRTEGAPDGRAPAGLHSQERDTGRMRLTDFWQRMADYFGEVYADSFARDNVMSELGGRTVHEALDDGWSPKDIWRGVCAAMDIPQDKR